MDGVRAMKETPTLNRMGETITLDFPEQMIHIQLDRWGDYRGDVTAEITVHVSAPGLPIDLHQSRVNLSSLGQREKLARILTGRYKGPDWTEIVEQIARQALAVRREGDPAINLAEQPADLRLAYRLESYVPEDGSTVLAADGGAGKSTLALFLCAAVGTGTPFLGLATRAGRVAFLDYETSARQQARRLRLIACGLELSEIPPVIYRHLDVPLPQCAPELRRFFQTERIDFAVLDSLGLAGGSQPDAEPTLAVFRVINSLQRPVLVLHHANRSGEIYGSVYVRNSARSLIEIKHQREAGDRALHLGLFHQKANDDVLQRPMGVEIQYLPDATLIRREEIVPELSAHLSITSRILRELRSEQKTPKELAATIGTTEATIRAKLNGALKGKTMKLPSGAWALLDPREAPV